MSDEIVEDVITTKTGSDTRLERCDQGQIKSLRPLCQEKGMSSVAEFIRGRSLNKQTRMEAQLS